MTTRRRYRSGMSKALHSSAAMLHNVGALDKATMRDFDARHLAVPAAIKPAEIKQLRERNHVSQPMFARYLNTRESTVEKWETGAKKPSGDGTQAADGCAEAWPAGSRLIKAAVGRTEA